MFSKKFKSYVLTYAVLSIILLGAVLLRLLLIHYHWPPTNGDEAVMDLMALHIATKGEHPMFFYGQNYMGTLQAYMGAVLYKLFGVSTFSVRVGLVLLFALYLTCTYLLVKRLYTRIYALAITLLLSTGSSVIIGTQLLANGGYAEVMFFGAFMFLVVAQLVLTSTVPQEKVQRTRRILLYFSLGCVIGFAIYTDQIILPCVVTAVALLVLFCWKELVRSIRGLVMLIGLALGALPLIIYNIIAKPGQNTLDALLSLQEGGKATIAAEHISLKQNILGAYFVSVPISTGYNSFCNVTEPLGHVSSLSGFFTATDPRRCIVLQGSWSALLIVLWLVAAAIAVYTIWQHYRIAKIGKLDADRDIQLRHESIQLMILVSTVLSLLLFIANTSSALFPRTSARYLICLPFVFPIILWPLWNEILQLKRVIKRITPRAIVLSFCSLVVLALISAMWVEGLVGVIKNVPDVQKGYYQQQALKDGLLKLGATDIYTDYRTCYIMAFDSQDAIKCISWSNTLGPIGNRYGPYIPAVQADPHPAYVFVTGSVQQKDFVAHESQYIANGYHQTNIENYTVYYHH